MNVANFDVVSIKPEKKDHDRVANLARTKEEAMAKSIKDPTKLLRRTKAYIAKNGDIPNPFVRQMAKMGFTESQIAQITKYQPGDEKLGSYAKFLNL